MLLIFTILKYMKKIVLVLNLILLLVACNNETSFTKPVEKDKAPHSTTKKLSVEEQAKAHIMRALSIPANEKFTYTIYKEHLDGDDKTDAIITLNPLILLCTQNLDTWDTTISSSTTMEN